MGVTSGVGVIVKPRRRFCAEANTFFSIGRDFVVVADDGENEWEMVEEGVRPWVSCSDWFGYLVLIGLHVQKRMGRAVV